jgi:hypothetical protein
MFEGRTCSVCDFTQFSADPAPIILPHGYAFKHEVGNEKWEILQPLPPYHCRKYKKGGISLPRVVDLRGVLVV